jgi:glucose/arabinose dehydrogenase
MDIAVAKDGRVFWVERHGYFRVWNPTTKTATLIKKMSVLDAKGSGSYNGEVESGLDGLVLAQDFEASHWIYMFYAVPSTTSSAQMGPKRRIARFTLKNNDTEIDLTTEKVIYEFQYYAQCCHYGGALDWGPGGNLYFSTGDNIPWETTGANPWGNGASQDPRTTSSNTNDPRGKIIRIHPKPFPDTETPAVGAGSTYDIPTGNLKEVWTSAEKSKMLPEIWSMGHRNPFTISVNSTNGWIGVGEANGDNVGQGDDEINVSTKPGNFGWPYLIGDNKAYLSGFWSGKFDPVAKADGLPNDGPGNTGASVLPPASGAALSRSHGHTAMSIDCHGVTWGWVEPPTVETGKVNSYLINKLIVGGFGSSDFRAATVSSDGYVTKLETLFKAGFAPSNVMRATQGPDGSFYVGQGVACCNFADNLSAAAIYKISYKGSCSTVAVNPVKVAKLVGSRAKIAHFGATKVEFPAGIKHMQAFDMKGQMVWEASREDSSRLTMEIIPANVGGAMLQMRYQAQ